MITGRFRAKCVNWEWCYTKANNEQIACTLQILEGEHEGESLTWFGSFTEKAERWTLEALRNMGWPKDSHLHQLGKLDAEVSIVVEADEYQGKTRSRVRYINKPGSGTFHSDKPMDDNQILAFAKSKKQSVIAFHADNNLKETDDDLPF
jgi:hypothetical protein